jgi:hypothetical protein
MGQQHGVHMTLDMLHNQSAYIQKQKATSVRRNAGFAALKRQTHCILFTI